MSTMPPPTAADYAGNQAPRLFAGNLIGAILATVSVALRFCAQWINGRRYGLDDYLILIALVLGVGEAAATIVMVHYGLGKHLNVLTPESVLACSKAYFASQIIWTVAILTTKTSILVMYNRMFGPHRYFHYATIGLGVFTIMWAITTLCIIVFQCKPVSYDWNKYEKGHCIHAETYFIFGSAMDVAVDVIIFVLPIHAVWNLHLSRTKRILLSLTFAVGSASVAFGITRLVEMCLDYPDHDWTWAYSGVTLWSTLEPCLAITAICLATCHPLYAYVIEKYKNANIRIGRAMLNKVTTPSTGDTRLTGRNSGEEEEKFENHESGRTSSEVDMHPPQMLGSEIHVRRDVLVRSATQG